MTRNRKAAKADLPASDKLERVQVSSPGQSPDRAVANMVVDPAFRHASMQATFGNAMFGGDGARVTEIANVLNDLRDGEAADKLKRAGDLLLVQATSLDSVFTNMLQNAAANIGQFPQATERYMRLALKAQAQSRATLEALVKLHQPREQTVHHRHYHVGPDGKAVFVENMYGGASNAGIDGQAHAAAGSAFAGGPPLLSRDAGGYGVPISSGARQEAVPDARRGEGERGAAGK